MVGAGNFSVWVNQEPTKWASAEIDRLIARLPEVPNQRFRAYVDAFRFGQFVSNVHKQKLLDQMRARLREAESTTNRDKKEIEDLKRLIEQTSFANPRLTGNHNQRGMAVPSVKHLVSDTIYIGLSTDKGHIERPAFDVWDLLRDSSA